MRPLKLRMSAFGPYIKEVSLDLESLGTSGIYLITGDTGAGKTTIFDGIVYALYGKPSGANRDENMLRSKNASPSTPTEVELDFSCRGNVYKILRSPAYSRPKKSGDGLTNEPAKVELHLPSGKIITKASEVNAEVEGIIGLTREQFLQIAMIAQGEFLKLLFASTDERIKIFQKIFKTKPYELLQAELSERAKELGVQRERARDSIRQYINGIQVKEFSPYEGELKMAKNDEMPITDVVDLIKKLIELDTIEREALKKELDGVEKEIAETSNNLSAIESSKKNKIQLEENQEKLAELEPKLALANKEFDDQKSEQRKAEKRELDKQIAQIDAELIKYDELDSVNADIAKNEKEAKELDDVVTSLNEDLLTLSKEIQSLENEQGTLKNAPEKRVRLEAKKSDLEEKQKKLRAFNASLKIREEKVDELAKSKQEYLKLSEISQKAQMLYMEKQRAFLDEQAGILASELKDGEPCIVCGSIHHPSPAKVTQGAPSKDELEVLERKKQIYTDNEQRASQECAQIKGALDVLTDKLQNELNEYFGFSATIENASNLILNAQNTLKAELDAIIAQIKELDEKIKRLKELEALIPSKKQELEGKKTALADNQSKIASYKASRQALEKRKIQIQGELKCESKDQAIDAKEALIKKQQILTTAYEKAEKNYNDLNSEHIALKVSIKELKTQLVSVKEFDEKKEAELLKSAKVKKSELLSAIQEHSTRITRNNDSLAEINKKIDYVSELDKKYAWVRVLADTANGTLSGKEKIKLETYIQMTYFDRIIRRANLRLLKMTSGQYELKRKTDESTKRGQSGLDLDVRDHYTGTERSVKSLSGGESFKASLSLALGLAEEIQSSAGGVQIDTMFVDEGFGSLDEESLDQAMNALTSLGDSNRLVGIISHVNELKNRIEKQIVITKDKLGGSTAKIIL